VAMVSVPRDLRVRVSGYGFSKVNAANAYGGAALAQQTIANTLGIPIHYYLTTNFKGLAQAVDAVGGLDVTVKERLYDSEYPCDDNQYKACGIDIAAGNYHMDGALALKYSRCRKGTCGNDFGRAARQQEIIQKLRDKVSTPAVYLSPTTDAALLGAVSSNSQTNMSANNLLELAWDLKGSKQTINFVLSTSPGGFLRGDPAGSSDLLPLGGDFSDIQDYVKNIFTLPVPESAIR
jgi:LCP family protein required for cell wall assembly